ncbi:MAG TPA: class I SAM-dependent methyltransferase [Ktedonobacteraceae bacterium]|jgi:SAM-dependent methyltransferase
MDMHQNFYPLLAAAYIRGKFSGVPDGELPELCARALEKLSAADIQQLFALARAHGLRLHRFKRSMELPRVRKVLGILRGLQPASLLDIGTGRGVFLWPLLDAFSGLPVTCIDCRDDRVADLQAVHAGGVPSLQALCADVRALPFAEHSFDAVTMLEVLEHVPDTGRALAEVSRVAGRFVLFSVPSQADNNPEHIYLFKQPQLRALLREHGMSRVSFDYVPGHMIVIARVDR